MSSADDATTAFRSRDRRAFLAWCSTFGLGGTLLPGILWARLDEGGIAKIDRAMLAHAEQLAGLEFTDDERDLMLAGLEEQRSSYRRLRTVALANSVPPAVSLRISPRPPRHARAPDSASTSDGASAATRVAPAPPPERPDDLEELAFWPLTRLAALVQARRVTSLELTRMYLARLERFDPLLSCVITRTDSLALAQAERADEEIAAGKYRGPLHGIPWGAKDLLSARGYPTTWGAKPFREQSIDDDATVVRRLEAAGAVLVAKLALGALAWGDVWFGGRTRNPWDPARGSSGSSAGPGAATAAGLVGFAIGSETWGSIVSPSTVCGVTGLRPTFGRVSRHGAMALSWSMDKLGPMCRSVEDCALVLQAIHGADENDPSAVDAPFAWDASVEPRHLRVGWVRALFESRAPDDESAQHDQATLETLRRLGVELVPIELPDLPVAAMSFILNAEAAAAFDELTRSGRDDELVRQVRVAWPNVFRQSRLIPAVEYIQANRVRTLAMRAMDAVFERIDAYVAPSFGGDNLLLTNLTGHPAVCVPNGFTRAGQPTSITFIGDLFAEAPLLALAKGYQDATDFHARHPNLVAPK